jgi:hypothetical protein
MRKNRVSGDIVSKETAPKYEEHAEIKINIKGISPVHLHKTRLIYNNEISTDYSWRL